MISVRSNGTFGVKYDEAGAPREDRISESRLRRNHAADRPTGNSSSTRSRSDDEQGMLTFEEGDTVLAAAGGRRGEDWKEATVEASLGDHLYRVSFSDGSGTRELGSDKMR